MGHQETQQLINKLIKVDNLMSQIDDLKAAVAAELTDVKELLDKLAASTVVQSNPDVAQAISDLQASHASVQAILNPVPPVA